MYTLKNKIINVNINYIDIVDIIWKSKKTTKCILGYIKSIDEHIICANDLCITGYSNLSGLWDNKYKFKIDMPENDIISRSIRVINDNLVFRCAYFNRVCIYNIATEETKYYHSSTPYRQILKVSNCNNDKIILLTGYLDEDQYGNVIVGNTIDECISKLDLRDYDENLSPSYSNIFRKNEIELICVSGTLFTVTDNQFKVKYSFSTLTNFFSEYNENVLIQDDIIYVWNSLRIAMIDVNTVYETDNIYGLIKYNEYYGIFINNKHELYKIQNNKVIRYIHNYDWVNDLDKPEEIEYIVRILIDFDWFPFEVINIIYQQYAKYYNHR